MGVIITKALVMRRADYGDYDRMITLFSPDLGRIDAIARGCRKAKSPLLNAVEPFIAGEYQLFERQGRFSVEQCQILESHYNLRTDFDKLIHANYWMRLLEMGVMPDVPNERLFIITLEALAHLNLSDVPNEMLTMAFEMNLARQLGLEPMVSHCVICSRPIDGDARFDAELGGCVCPACHSAAPKITLGARRIMYKLPRAPFRNVPLLEGHADWVMAARLFRGYIHLKLPVSGKFLPKLSNDV